MPSGDAGYIIGVTYEQMALYVSRAKWDIQRSIEQLGDKIDNHNKEHQDALTQKLEGIRAGRLSQWSVVIAALALLATVTTVILAIAGHG